MKNCKSQGPKGERAHSTNFVFPQKTPQSVHLQYIHQILQSTKMADQSKIAARHKDKVLWHLAAFTSIVQWGQQSYRIMGHSKNGSKAAIRPTCFTTRWKTSSNKNKNE